MATELKGVALSAEDLVLSPVQSPSVVGEAGTLAFRVLDGAGRPVTDYARTHEKELHLIVVRSDGADFQHVHPTLDAATGTWSIPWTWTDAGSFRVYADFATRSGSAATLTRTVEVAGTYAPVVPQPSRVSVIDGYTVSLDGDLTGGSTKALTLAVSRDGAPVRDLQPYLGAFGHLVALRQGDLAFLHVHPEGAMPAAGDLGGPDITFQAAAPSAGRYLLYLDFKAGGVVRTATFVLDAPTAGAQPASDHETGHGH